MDKINALKSLLAIPKDIVITSHRNPDGDAIGSSLGLKHYLEQLGHTVKVVFPSEFPNFLGWMQGAGDIIIYDVSPEEAKSALEKPDLVFCLDFNSLERIDKMGELIGYLKCPKVLIDHHLFPEPFADFELHDITASSTSELVYDFIILLADKQHLNKTIAECLFTGILTDTGSFKYATSPKLFRLVADLLELGVDDTRIQNLVFNCMEEKHLRLLGYVLNTRMEILEEYRTAIISLSKQDYEKYTIQRGDTEGLVNYLLMMKNVTMAAFIHEQPTITKISLRSKGDFSVQEIARQHFKGGGHKNASGGYSYIGLRPTIKKFKSILPEYQQALLNNDL
ncbi:MAG: bifunctional oligoribonuclease/PAP phosphatase NrnA [Lewinellaceae bacterium]|nr:bifunctional oligoribonuclease/PAP phosphatase NrnA [Saprospiraceae bacterium]MCB9340086.1 bifunctional oligoribonuclease/PAP phosphatase NrnA [Lewinellaceae bacterium]